MQQKSNNLSKLLKMAAPSIDNGSLDPFEQACLLIDCAQGGLHGSLLLFLQGALGTAERVSQTVVLTPSSWVS